MEYKQERYALNRWCQFRSQVVEAEFMNYERAASLGIVRVLMLIVGSIFALFIFSDVYFYRYKDIFPVAILLRAIGLTITIVTFFLIRRVKRYNNVLIVVTLAQLVIFAIYLLNLHLLQANQLYLQFMTAMLFVMAVFLIPNLWKNCVIAACVILAGYITFRVFLLVPAETVSTFMQGIYLGICLICCAIFLFGRETSRRKQFATEKLLEHMAITDGLTNIYNRARFEHVLGGWIKNKRRSPFSLLLFDIDNFKKVNDRFGHTAGDQVLVGVSEQVSAHIRDEDIFARWGGEEFVILFGGTGLEKASELAERLRRAVEVNPHADVGKVTISIGIAEYREGETITEFVNRADEKMYEAKKAGKNQVMK